MAEEAKRRHLADQLGAVLEDVAPVLGQYHRALEDEGLPEQVIAELLVAIQTRLLGQRDKGAEVAPPDRKL